MFKICSLAGTSDYYLGRDIVSISGCIRWFHHKTYPVIYPVLGSRFSSFVLICHGKLPVSPQRNLAFAAFMPTVRWEERKHSPHFFYQSLERFKMVQMLEDLEMFLLFLFRQRLSGVFFLFRQRLSSFLTICFTALAMMCLKNDLYGSPYADLVGLIDRDSD
jgi:hypothetical protein